MKPSGGKDKAIRVDMEINGHSMSFTVDTASAVSIVGEDTYYKYLSHLLGQLDVAVKYEDQEKVLPLFNAKGARTSPLGRSWMRFVKLNWEGIFSVKVSSIDEMLKKYSSVFTTGDIVLMKEFQTKIELMEEASPKFHEARPVPYAPKEGVGKELDGLETAGVMRKVERSDWASPIVVVPKADGKEHDNADLMNRAPFEEAKCDIEAEVNYLSHTSELPITAKEIAESTRKDKVLACVLECTLSGWPEDMDDDRKMPHTVTGVSPAQS